MKRKKDKVFFWICIVICILSITYIVYYYLKKTDSHKDYAKVKKQVIKEEKPEKKKEEIPIDFAKLKNVNSDIYGWIQVPDTNIDYPILQNETNDAFYLDHAFDKKYDVFGAIFTERINAKDFTDFNTVIYGHNIKDGSFFQNLHKFEDDEFFNSHDTFTIYTETEKKTYKIFAAVEYSSKH
ncbi:sortase domain-containing protein, partial [Faecalimonas sp.]